MSKFEKSINSVNIVNDLFSRHGENEIDCAEEYLRCNKKSINRKIRKIALYYPIMNRGGVQRVLSLLMPLYESMNYEVVLITEEISPDDYDIPATVKRFVLTATKNIINGIDSYKCRASELAQILENEGIDVFIHNGVRNTLFVYDIVLANLMGVYTVAVKHQVFTQGFCEINDLFFLHNNIFRIVDRLVVLSGTEELYWKVLGINAGYIENPFNLSLYPFRHSKTDSENIVWVGRLDIDSKQYFDVLNIAKLVIAERPLAKFLMYGSGTEGAINELNRRIYEYGLENHVLFCGYEADVKHIYEDARIHLVTSAYEAFPMGIYESRICGIPMVMYELPYLELLKERKGYLSSVNGDIEDVAKNICKILNDKELETKLQLEAKESVSCFSNDIVCNKWKKLFTEIENGTKEEIGKNEEFEIIIQTMHKHFSIAQKKYQDLLWHSEQEKAVYHVRKGINAGKKVVICPYGAVGKKVKKMINEKGIQETYIVDNFLSKYDSSIKSLQEIERMDCSELFFIICSERSEIKEFFVNQLMAITNKNSIACYDDAIIE